MEYTKPVIYNIPAFEAKGIYQDTVEHKVAFTNLSTTPSTISAKLNIYKAINEEAVEQEQTITLTYKENDSNSSLSIYIFNIPKVFIDNMENGVQYYMTMTVTGDTATIVSDACAFWCYTTPDLTLQNIEGTYETPYSQSSCIAKFTYEQKEGELLNSYRLLLYKGGIENLVLVRGDLVADSGLLYDENYRYKFENLETENSYQIELECTTIEGTKLSISTPFFFVRYDIKQNSAIITAKNDCENGCVKVETYFDAIPGTNNGATVLNDEANILPKKYDDRTTPNIEWAPNITNNTLDIKIWDRGNFITASENILEMVSENKENITIENKSGTLNSTIEKDVRTKNLVNGFYLEDAPGNETPVFSFELSNLGEPSNLYRNDKLQTFDTTSPENLYLCDFCVAKRSWAGGDRKVDKILVVDLNKNSIYEYDETYHGANTWYKLKTFNTYLAPMSVIYTGEKIFVFGANGMAYAEGLSDVIDFTNLKWTEVQYGSNKVAKMIRVKYDNGVAYGIDRMGYICYCSDINSNPNFIVAYNQVSNSLIDRPLNLRPGLGLFYFKNKYFIYGLYKKIFMSENGRDWQEYTNTEMPDKIDQIANFSMWKYNDKLYGAFFKCFEQTDVANVYFRVMYSYDGLSWYKLFEEKTDRSVRYYCPIWCVYKNDQNVPYLYFYKDGIKLTYMAKYALTFNKNKQTQQSIESNSLEDVGYDDKIFINSLVKINDDDTFNTAGSKITISKFTS